MDNPPHGNTDWLHDVLEEVSLEQFYSKLINDLQVTKLSHFDFVSESDLVGLGMSKPAAKRLLAFIRKRKSFVTALKNKFVNKLSPISSSSTSATKPKHHHYEITQPKSKSKLSRLFGINETSVNQAPIGPLLPHSYHKFNNKTSLTPGIRNDLSPSCLLRSKSDEFSPFTKLDTGPPLIDLSDDAPIQISHNMFSNTFQSQQESLIDMDNSVPTANLILQRHSSETKLNQYNDDNYQLSWAGSWNTGTFDGSNENIYSGYYCPIDLATTGNKVETDANLYYSVVTQEDDRVLKN